MENEKIYARLKNNRFQAELNRFFQLSIDLFCIAGFDGYFKWVSPASKAILSYREAELKTRPFLDFVHPEDRNATLIAIAKLAQDEVIHNFENRYRAKDGTYKWLLWNGIAVLSENLIYCTARDITARKQAALALQESEERYRSVVTAMAEGVVLQDANGLIQASNTQAEAILGLSVEQMMGKTSFDPNWKTIQEDGSPFRGEEHPAMVTLQTGKPCSNVVMGIYKPKGELTWISINSQPLFYPNEAKPYAVVTSFTDITNRKQTEEMLRQQIQRERLLGKITNHIHQSLDLGEILRTTVTEIRKFLQCDRVLIYRLEDKEKNSEIVVETVNSSCLSTDYASIAETRFIVDLTQRYYQGKIAVINDIYQEALSQSYLEQLHCLQIRAYIVIPIINDEESWGLLIAQQFNQPRDWQEFEIDLLQQVSTQAAIAIQKSELYLQAQQEIALRHQAEVRLRQQVKQEKLIGKMLDRIRQSLDLETVLNTTVAEVKNFLKCDRVLIFRLNPQGGGNVIAESVEIPWSKILDSHIYDPCFQNSYVETYRQGKVTSIDDIDGANLQPCYVQLLKKFQVRASLVVPILQNQQLWGLLIAHQCSGPRVWQDRNKSLLQQLATQVAIAIQQSQLYQQTCYQAEREKVLNRVLQAIHSSLDLQAIFKAAVSEIGNLLQVDRVTIAEYQVPKAVWQIVAEYRLSEDLSTTTGLEIPDDNNEIAARLKRRETIIVNNTITEIQQSDEVNSSLAVLFPHSWLMVPLWVEHENQVWGSLNLWHEKNSHTWQESEIELAQIVANQLAIALNQSQLYQKLQKANQELERIATLDSLTEIANRRYFDSILEREWQRLQREKQPLSLIFCDVDYFKKYNDTYGHQSGDRCLRQVAQALKKAIKRPGDLVARYGGEEFVIILPNTPLEGAKAIGERLRQAIQALQIAHKASPISPYITLSLGLSSLIPQPETSANTLVENADRALYEAKKQGRDRLNWC